MPVRVWVCGCSTGEEAYSIAILIQEHLETLKQTLQGADLCHRHRQAGHRTGPRGVYPASIAADISPERLARFFTQEPDGGAYRIQKVIRDLLYFPSRT